MKKVILIIAITFLSCKKDSFKRTACYECTIVTSSAYYNDVTVVRECNLTKKEARELEISGTNNYHGVSPKTTCKKL